MANEAARALQSTSDAVKFGGSTVQRPLAKHAAMFHSCTWQRPSTVWLGEFEGVESLLATSSTPCSCNLLPVSLCAPWPWNDMKRNYCEAKRLERLVCKPDASVDSGGKALLWDVLVLAWYLQHQFHPVLDFARC